MLISKNRLVYSSNLGVMLIMNAWPPFILLYTKKWCGLQAPYKSTRCKTFFLNFTSFLTLCYRVGPRFSYILCYRVGLRFSYILCYRVGLRFSYILCYRVGLRFSYILCYRVGLRFCNKLWFSNPHVVDRFKLQIILKFII